MKKIGKPIVFNICMLGAVIGITKLVKPESIMKTLQSRINPEFLDINQKALDIGIAMVKD
jgi:2-oxoglutarate ferredoxin oxidoreductase subunit gamma